ncbi:MAG: thiamine phosphate synthase [Methylococcales bacterium]|nr:thiamine phosphate synthase [Methylococcales bacterium]
MRAMPKSGLYAITPDGKTAEEILEFTQAVLKGGAKVVQYRDKNANDKETIATALLTLCHTYNVPLIINDNVELADKIGADGVHLGKDDGNISPARARLGERAIIGVSCYNSLERAVAAEKEGATYVAFGRFFSSTSKPLAAPAQIGTLTAAKKILTVPIVAIGGVLPENGASLLNAGADLLAVIGGLATENPRLSAQDYCRLFSQ